jgi:hypothetical protein
MRRRVDKNEFEAFCFSCFKGVPEFSGQDSGDRWRKITPRQPPYSGRARLGINIYDCGADAGLLSGDC